MLGGQNRKEIFKVLFLECFNVITPKQRQYRVQERNLALRDVVRDSFTRCQSVILWLKGRSKTGHALPLVTRVVYGVDDCLWVALLNNFTLGRVRAL